MTDRERLVERIQISVPPNVSHWAEVIADELLADGWMIPPCKVGTTVFQIVHLKDKTGFIVERKVVGFHIGEFPDIRGHKRGQYLIVHHDASNTLTHIDIKQIGKTVFLSREEAEKALKGGGNG